MSRSKGFVWADVPGLSLTSEDKEILAHPSISGVVLFAKNYASVDQMVHLTRAISQINSSIIITVDQEGGRVQRFREGFTTLPAMSHWGRSYLNSPEKTAAELKAMQSKQVTELKAVGVYAALSPVLDIDYGHNAVIGERSFGHDALLVTTLGRQFINNMHQLGMPVVGKHFPGHGFVSGDSHHVLPVDTRSLSAVQAADMQPFIQLLPKLDAIMPAHIVYADIDQYPAGFSRFWLKTVLRDQLQFNGLIITDDLTMQGAASYGDYIERARLALDAGADILTVCNSREGLIDILDRVHKSQDDQFAKRLANYTRFMSHN